MEGMRIAYVFNGVQMPGGGLRIAFEQINRLAARSCRLWIVNEKGQTSQDWFPNLRAPIVAASELPPVDLIVAAGEMVPYFVDTLGRDVPKVFLVQSPDRDLFPNDPEWAKALEAVYRRTECHILTISDGLKEWIERNYGREAFVVVAGVNGEEMFPDPDPALREGERRPIVLIEGAPWQPYKGVADALEALKELDAAVWAVASNGVIEGADRFWVSPSRDLFRKLLSTADVVLKNSHVEGLGLTAMEAMACGTALVATDTVGTRQYCRHEENCLMTAPKDISAQRAAVKRLIEDRPLRERLAAAGLELARREFDWEPKIDRLKIFFERILKNNA